MRKKQDRTDINNDPFPDRVGDKNADEITEDNTEQSSIPRSLLLVNQLEIFKQEKSWQNL